MRWRITVKHIVPTLFVEWIASGIFERVYEVTGFRYTDYKKVSGFTYLDADTEEQFFVHVIKQFNADPLCLERYYRCGISQCRLLETCGESAALTFATDKTLERLVAQLTTFGKAYESVSPFLLLPPVVEKILIERVQDIVATRTGLAPDSSECGNLVQNLIAPDEKTRFAEAQEEVLKFAVAAAPSKRKLDAALNNGRLRSDFPARISDWATEYIGNYSWINYEHGYGTDYTREDAFLRLRDLIEHDPKARLSHIQSAVREQRRRKAAFLRRHELSETERQYLTTMAHYVFFRNYRLESYNIAGRSIRPILSHIGECVGLPYDDLVYLTLKEIGELIRSRDAGMKELARERRRDFGLLMVDGAVSIYNGEAAASLQESQVVDENVTVLRGVGANPGTVEGSARVVFDKRDFPKVARGDIVVCSMTTPEYTLVLERAAGIATDLGGLTSHQVQTSRDLGIPCVIDLKTATAVIKDGERLRLNATEGTVERLDRISYD